MGDCRAIHTPEVTAVETSAKQETEESSTDQDPTVETSTEPSVKQESVEPSAELSVEPSVEPSVELSLEPSVEPSVERSPKKPAPTRVWHRRFQTKLEDLGKVTYAKVDLIEGSMEGTVVYNAEKCHVIVSPRLELQSF